MSYLNNKTTGETIKIFKSTNLKIYYKIFENTYFAQNDLFPIIEYADPRDIDIIPSIALNELDLINYTSILKVADKYKDLEETKKFIIDEDSQNWIIPARPKRIIVENEFLINTMLSDDEFKGVIDKLLIEQKTYIYKGKYGTVVYINDIDAPDLPSVLPYIQSGNIIIENRL